MNDEKILVAYLKELAKEHKAKKKSNPKKNEAQVIRTINELEGLEDW